MHIADGILSPAWVIFWWLVALVFIAIGVIQIRRKSINNAQYLPMLALMSAAVLVISVWHVPVPVTGSSSHPCGTPMAAIIVGPFPVAAVTSIVLFFQTFVGHGGLTTIGANDWSMGIVGAFSGYGVWLALRGRTSIFWAAGLAGFVGDILTYLTAAFELAISIHPEAVLRYIGIFMLGYAPTQLPLAIMELVFTGLVVRYIAEVRPEMMKYAGWTPPPVKTTETTGGAA
ncbi:MAG: energy-coupling factor ABC transporter permease [Halobacteriota archaeon]